MSIPALSVTNLSKSFGGLQAVSDVSFDVEDGSITALIGPNGAGKTTLFNLITNVYQPTKGDVRLYGQRINGMQGQEIAKLGLIRTFQSARVFPGLTTIENVLVGAHLHIRHHPARQMLWLSHARREERELVAKADALLELFSLSAFRDVAATDLPMGVQKLLDVIRALMARPRLLLLDEPAAGLNDSETEELAVMLAAIRGTGITVVVVEHNMSLVMGLSDKVLVLDAGRFMAQGTAQEIQTNATVLDAYIGKGLEEAAC